MTKDLTSTVRQQPDLILTIPTELSILASDPSDHLPPRGQCGGGAQHGTTLLAQSRRPTVS